MKNLYVLDDEPDYVDFVCEAARSSGINPNGGSHPTLFAQAYRDQWDLIVLDLQMPGYDGVEILRILADKGCSARLILASGFDVRVLQTARELAESLDLKVAGTLLKPFELNELQTLFDLPIAPRLRPMRTSRLAPDPVDLEKAILDRTITAHFQPKVDLNGGGFAGAEGLARWTHPRLGAIAPTTFIPQAEEHGLIEPLTELMLDMSFAACRKWKRSGLSGPVSVNVPVACLVETSLPDRIDILARRHDLDPADVVIEVTESGRIADQKRALEVLSRLRLKGLRLSIDDFGTGYSSLEQLRRVPFTELKIDQEFVRSANGDSVAWQICEKVIELGHQLGMVIVAEGVETRRQASLMGRMGCDVGQGFLWARPMPLDEMIAWGRAN